MFEDRIDRRRQRVGDRVQSGEVRAGEGQHQVGVGKQVRALDIGGHDVVDQGALFGRGQSPCAAVGDHRLSQFVHARLRVAVARIPEQGTGPLLGDQHIEDHGDQQADVLDVLPRRLPGQQDSELVDDHVLHRRHHRHHRSGLPVPVKRRLGDGHNLVVAALDRLSGVAPSKYRPELLVDLSVFSRDGPLSPVLAGQALPELLGSQTLTALGGAHEHCGLRSSDHGLLPAEHPDPERGTVLAVATDEEGRRITGHAQRVPDQGCAIDKRWALHCADHGPSCALRIGPPAPPGDGIPVVDAPSAGSPPRCWSGYPANRLEQPAGYWFLVIDTMPPVCPASTPMLFGAGLTNESTSADTGDQYGMYQSWSTSRTSTRSVAAS